MRVFLLIFVIGVVGLGCNPSKTYELPFAGSKIVINAVLIANEAPEVYVGKTWSATGQIPENVHLEKATVLLFEGELLLGRMVHRQNGVYTLAQYKLLPEKSYTIKASADGLPNAESAPVKIPSSFPLQSIQLDRAANVSSINGPGAKPVLLRVFLREDSSEFLGILAETYTDGYINATQITPLETSVSLGASAASDCFFTSGLFGNLGLQLPIYRALLIYNTFCLRNSRTLNVVVETNGSLQKPGDYSRQDADEIRVQLVNCSPEYVEYTKRNRILEGMDFAFNEPTPTYTNVKGGYGVIVAINRLSLSLRL